MKYLNSQQLAFILDIKKEDARAKMCVAWASAHNEENKAARNIKGKIEDPYPIAMPIEMLSQQLNLPTLQQMVDDITNNYLTRPASRKWILCDYPEKQLLKVATIGEDKPVSIPPALKSMLPKETKEKIVAEWNERFPKMKVRV